MKKSNKDELLSLASLLPSLGESRSRYPTLLTEVPIFSPINGRGKAATEHTRGVVYSSRKGQIERFGPGLDIYDEDTLIAIMKLAAEKRLEGPSDSMPIQIEGSQKDVVVYVGKVSAPQINEFLGRGFGGADLECCRESIRRLAFTRLRLINDISKKEGITGFFDYIGDNDYRGELLIQLSPMIVDLLQTYIEIDMQVRRKLSDTGKSIHRFLGGQSPESSITLEGLKEHIGYDGSLVDLKYVLMGKKASKNTKERVSQLQIMKDAGWLDGFELIGTGRKTPYELRTWRKINN